MTPYPLFLLAAAFQAAPPAGEAPLAVVHADVLPMDVAEGAPAVLRDHTLVVRDGRIERLGPASEVAVPEGARVVDGSGKYLLPGLVDAHTHTFSAEDFELHVAHGVTTAWEMAGNPQLLAWRAEIAAGERLGPRLFVTGPQLKVEAIPFTDMEIAAGSPARARDLVEGMAADGYDFVKVWGPLPEDVLVAVGEAAGEAGLPVTGHIPGDVGLARTLECGLAAVAHVEEYWNKVLRRREDAERLAEAVALTAEAGAVAVTTLVTYENIAQVLGPDLTGLPGRGELRYVDPVRRMLWGPEYNDYRRRFEAREGPAFAEALESKQRIARALHDAGVPLLAGSDAGGFQLSLVPGLALHRELELLVDAGLTPLEALRAATSVPGRFLAPGDPSGVLAPGRRADLLLVDGNPLEDVGNIRRIAGVAVAGRWLDRAELDGRLEALAARNGRTGAFVESALGGESAMEAYRAARDAASPDGPLFQEAPLLLLAFLYFQSGRQEEALELLQVVAREYPESYAAYYVLAAAARVGGDADGARELLRAVLDRSPRHRIARETLAELGR